MGDDKTETIPKPPATTATTKSLPSPPALPFPPRAKLAAVLHQAQLPSSDLALDPPSIEHLSDLIKQSLANIKVQESVWLDTILLAAQTVANSLSLEALAAIFESAIAEWKAQDLAERRNKTASKTKDKKGKEKEVPISDEEKKQKIVEERRTRWREARDLLERPSSGSPASVATELEDIVEGDGDSSPVDAGKESDSSTQNIDSSWTKLDEHPRLTKFRLMLRTTETSVGAVKTGATRLGVTYEEGKWEGRPLFGRDPIQGELDAQDLENVTLLGGTLHLTCHPKDHVKLDRVLELVSFAALSLKLENHLLRDTSCPRPLLDLDSISEVSSIADESLPSSTAHLPIASEPGASIVPTEPEETKKKGHKSKWSSSNLWGLIRGAASTSSSPPTPSPPSTPGDTSPSGIHHHHKVKDKLKGLGGLKLRKSRSKRRNASDSSGTAGARPSLDLEALDTWDFVGGLGLAGLGFGNLRGVPTLEEPAVMKAAGEVGVGKDGKKAVEDDENMERFQKVIKKIEACILSVSPNVIYPPPHLLVRLRKQEIEHLQAAPPTDLPPPEALPPPVPPKPAPLLSPLGWPSRPPVDRLRSYSTIDARTLAMGFASGHAALPEPPTPGGSGMNPVGTVSSTTSHATRITLDARAGLASMMTNNNSLGGTMRHQEMHFLVETACTSAGPTAVACQPPKWLKYLYWERDSHHTTESKEGRPDFTVGQLIERLVAGQDEACPVATCKRPGFDHSTFWMHGSERICISMSKIPGDDAGDEKTPLDSSPFESTRPRIATWLTCRTCHAQTSPALLSLAAYSFSFSKFAELIIYDSDLVPLPELCEHAGVDRFAMVRSFAIGSTVVSLATDKIELFELRLPTSVDPFVSVPATTGNDDSDLTSIEFLRTEIKSFYTSVKDRLDELGDHIGHSSTLKAHGGSALERNATIKRPEPTRTDSESTIHEDDTELPRILPPRKTDLEPIVTSFDDAEEDGEQEAGAATVKNANPVHLLRILREGVENDETDLLLSVSDLTPHHLNNGRWFFLHKAKAAKARLAAWEEKHSPTAPNPASKLPPPEYIEPDYFSPAIHIFPVDSWILLRESELSSAIALTLSAPAFQNEVTGPSIGTNRKVTPNSYFGTPTPSTSRKSSRHPIPDFSSTSDFGLTPPVGNTPLATPPVSPRLGSSPSRQGSPRRNLDPDDPACDFAPSDSVHCVAKLKKEARPQSLILSGMRGLTRQKSSESSFGFFRSATTTPTTEEPVTLEDNRKTLSDSVLEDLVTTSEPAPPPSPRPPSAQKGSLPPSLISGITKRHVSEATTCSSISFTTVEVELSGPGHSRMTTTGSMNSTSSMDSRFGLGLSAEPTTPTGEDDEDDEVAPLDSTERSGSKLVSALWSLPNSIRSRTPGHSPKLGSTDHGSHVKFKFRHGDKAFRVTAYHAEKFQALRTRCGLSEDLFIESLSRCTDLNTTGGKSKSAFWMTGDKRFMLKELVTAWGVSEKEAFLQFAPELLGYLMAPERPSLLAKIFGFYTIKTKNLKTGEVRKLDLIVMEHLFHSQTITRQFDLKGIASRVAKPKSTASSKDNASKETLWDADWLSGSLQSRLLIYSHSKTLLRDALLNDSQFLAKCGNIDYSLLVGVNDTTHELVVGLIDIISVFNLAKMLENAGKTALKKATASEPESVTVIPPSDYALRFRQAMEKYFIAIPGKFSRGMDELEQDPRLAPVL